MSLHHTVGQHADAFARDWGCRGQPCGVVAIVRSVRLRTDLRDDQEHIGPTGLWASEPGLA